MVHKKNTITVHITQQRHSADDVRAVKKQGGTAKAYAKLGLAGAALLAVALGSHAMLNSNVSSLGTQVAHAKAAPITSDNSQANTTLAIAALPKLTTLTAPELTPPPAFPKETKLTVGKGDTLIEMLTDTGVSHQEAHEAVAAIRKIYDPRRINSGQALDVTLEASAESPDIPSLSALRMPVSSMATISLNKIENGKFVVKKIEVPVTAHPSYHKLSIVGSLYQTARRAGMSPKMIMEMMKGFSYDVDFQRDVQRGHTLEVVVDTLKRDDDGSVVGAENLRFAKLTLGKKKVAMYRFTDRHGQTAYYDAKGKTLKKTLLRTPVDGARISSRYGLRKHPVLGYNKMHKGVDFAAPTGTPIYAAGDGVVDYAGRKGSFGNYVRIKHNGTYSTAYAHAHRIAKGIRKGKRVRQGQIIAYVGTTGRSTGPHLHYEVHKHGKQTNPSKVQQLGTGVRLAGNDLKKFKALIKEVSVVKTASAKPKNQAAKKADNSSKANASSGA